MASSSDKSETGEERFRRSCSRVPVRVPAASVRSLLCAALICSGIASSSCGGGSAPAPNIVLISVDTLRADRLGCYGAKRETSPTIDALARRGVLYEDVTATSPWTLPSHASLLTGLYPSRHGVKDREHQLGAEVLPLAEILTGAGYRTRAIVNALYVSERFGLGRGFEAYDYVSEWAVEPNGRRSIVNRGEEITDAAIDYVRSRGDERFFLFLHYYDVHTDLDPAPVHRESFTEDYPQALSGRTDELLAVRKGQRNLSDRDVRHLFDLYDAEIRTLDDQLKRLFEALEASGRSEDTLVVLTSDHGEEWMEHGSVLHGRTYYQEVIGVPLIVAGPGVDAGVRVEEPVSLIDVFPTLLALTGLSAPAGIDGRDLGPLARGEAPSESRFLFAEADHNNVVNGEKVQDLLRMVRSGDWKLQLDTVSGAVELYDLASDPGETRDLSESEPDRTALLLERLKAFLEAEASGSRIAPPSSEELDRLRALGY